jgi:calcineurin-like phosphoesterase family protein
MTNWVTSDLHLWHKRIIEFCPKTRPYDTLEDMHESFRDTWLKTVTAQDTVYILGDVSFGSFNKTKEVFEGLLGRIVVIQGNHDDPRMLKAFSEVHAYHETVISMTKVCMFHFPIQAWHRKERGSVHLHGHMHGNGQDLTRRRDVGKDATGKWLTNADLLVSEIASQTFKEER